MKVSEAIIQRFTCKSYKNDSIVHEDDLKKILALTQRAPTCFNSQPWVAVVVRRGTVESNQLVNAAFASNQQRICDAAATVVFCADLEPMRNLDRLADLSALQGYDREEARARAQKPLTAVACHVKPLSWIIACLKTLLLPILGMFTPVMTAMIGESTRTWCIKQTMFAASTFMLAATEYGYHTSPMEGFDADRARLAVGLPKRYAPTLMVSIGHAAQKPNSAALRFAPQQVFFDGHASRPFEGIEPVVQLASKSHDDAKTKSSSRSDTKGETK